ncbi:MAG: hypothetical protein IIA67_04335 [Planctomycetes bacterium]|nr:hypothetical protein [Planctomycetota bacterium]
MYGTLARKGDDTADRPHRLARILSRPDELLVVDVELLQALAGEVNAGQPLERQHIGTGDVFDVEAFIVRNNLDVEGPGDWNGKQGLGRAWTFRTSPMCEHHDDDDEVTEGMA